MCQKGIRSNPRSDPCYLGLVIASVRGFPLMLPDAWVSIQPDQPTKPAGALASAVGSQDVGYRGNGLMGVQKSVSQVNRSGHGDEQKGGPHAPCVQIKRTGKTSPPKSQLQS